MTAALAIGAFALGVLIVIWSTERLLEGMVGLAGLLHIAPFVIAGVFSGLEAENIAVGVIAARDGHSEIALGVVFGGATFVICVALGLGAVLFPLKVTLPRGILLSLVVAPVLAAVPLIGGNTSRTAGVVLLAAFAASIWYLVHAAKNHDFLGEQADEICEATAKSVRWWQPVVLTVLGLAVLTLGAELVNYGADGIIGHFAFPAALMGMIVVPAAIEAEEVIRQAVPAKQGRHDVAAGNLVGTLFYFVLFNLGLIALAVPVPVPPRVLTLDWPFLIGATWLATAFLWRGRLTRIQGAILLTLYGAYIAASILVER